jgi:hypothetical protein
MADMSTACHTCAWAVLRSRVGTPRQIPLVVLKLRLRADAAALVNLPMEWIEINAQMVTAASRREGGAVWRFQWKHTSDAW